MRLPQFRLRTLFVIVVLIAIPLGWFVHQLDWIRRRREFLQRPEVQTYDPLLPGPVAKLPRQLRFSEELPITYIVVPGELTWQAQSLFPEAIISWPD